jgi:hypothetical protein
MTRDAELPVKQYRVVGDPDTKLRHGRRKRRARSFARIALIGAIIGLATLVGAWFIFGR